MIETKLFEIRDRNTFIPAIGIEMDCSHWLMRRAGYGERCILFTRIGGGGNAEYDPYNWVGSRTMKVAHHHIDQNWDTLKSGDLIDVEFILKETLEPAESEEFG